MYLQQEPTSSVINTPHGLRHWEKRHFDVQTILLQNNVKRLLDIGCNDAKFIQRLTRSEQFSLLAGLDMDSDLLQSTSILNIAPQAIQDNILYDRNEPLIVSLYSGDATIPYDNIKCQLFQAITLVQVIEHLPVQRLPFLNECLFNYYGVNLIIMTTPNIQFNVYFKNDNQRLRHWDHKFEWTRAQFQQYCEGIKEKYPYDYQLFTIGQHITQGLKRGPCSQGVIFKRRLNTSNSSISSKINVRLIKEQKYPFWKDSYKNHLINLIIQRCFYLYSKDYDQTFYCLQQVIKNNNRIQSILFKSKTTISQLRSILSHTQYLVFDEQGKVRYNYEEPEQQEIDNFYNNDE